MDDSVPPNAPRIDDPGMTYPQTAAAGNTDYSNSNQLTPLTLETLKSNFEPNMSVQSSQLKKVLEGEETNLMKIAKAAKIRHVHNGLKPEMRWVPMDRPASEAWDAESEYKRALEPWEEEEERIEKANNFEKKKYYESFNFSEFLKYLGKYKVGTEPINFKDTSKRQFFYKVIDDEQKLASFGLNPSSSGQKTRLFLLFMTDKETPTPST